MPYHLEVNRQHRLLRGVLEGAISDAGLREFYAAIAGQSAALQPAVGIVDCTRVTGFDVSSETIRYLASQSPAFGGAPRCIVTPPDYMFGLARMFQILGEESRPDLYVVRTLKEACEKLGIPDNLAFEPLA